VDDLFVEENDRFRVAHFVVRSSIVTVRLVAVLSPSPPDMFRDGDALFVEEDFIVLEENVFVVEELVVFLESLVIFLESPVVFLESPVVFLESPVVFLESPVVFSRASVVCRLAPDVFLFEHELVVAEDDVFLEEIERCLEQLAKCLDENVFVLETNVKLLSAAPGCLSETVSLSTPPVQGDTQLEICPLDFFSAPSSLLDPANHVALRSVSIAPGLEATTRRQTIHGSSPSRAVRFRQASSILHAPPCS
jgi:hypothetical protein